MAWFRRDNKPPEPGPSRGPDFGGVVSPSQVDDLVAQGILEAFWLLPGALGGADVPENIVYLPRGLEAARESFLRIALDAFGGSFSYSAVPDYAGQSRVPIRVRFTATPDDPNRAPVHCDLAVWGGALSG